MSATLSWLILLLAGLFEIGWAVGIKYTAAFTRLWPSVLTLAAMAASVGLLSVAMKTLPAGTSYAVWTGIGTAGTALLGVLLLRESMSLGQWLCIGLILCGVAGLKLLAPD